MAAVLAEGVWNRKAGRYDYNRFDHIASTSASVGCELLCLRLSGITMAATN